MAYFDVPTVKAWNKKSRSLFDILAKDGRADSGDIHFNRALGRKYPHIFDKKNGVMDILPTGRGISILLPRKGIKFMALPEYTSRANSMMYKKKYGFFRE